MDYLAKATDSYEVLGHSYEQRDFASLDAAKALADNLDAETTLIILAAIKRQMGDSIETFEANMKITANICRALAKSPVKRVVFVSSAAVYGEDVVHDAITEETHLYPRTFYGLAKYNAEWMLRKAIENGGAQSFCIIRPPTIYGPGDTSLSYGPPQFIDRAIKGEPITLWGDGSEIREFIFIEDAARIIAELAQSDFDGAVNLASGHSYSFIDVLDAVAAAAGVKLSVESRPRSKDKVDHNFNSTRLYSLLPHTSFLALEDGVRELFKAMQEDRSANKVLGQ